MSCGLGYRPISKRSKIWGNTSRELNRKGLTTGEIVDGQWGVGETQSKGVRRMEDGRGGSGGENG